MEPTNILPIVAVLSLVTVEYGGWALLTFISGREGMADWQTRFFRAGHAHAGVLLVLALVYLLYLPRADFSDKFEWIAGGVLLAGVLAQSGGFFLHMGVGQAIALLDFDFASPGRPVWDLAHTARMWIPLRPPELAGERSHLDPFHRLAVLADGYGLDGAEHQSLVEAIIASKRRGTRFVERRVRAGESAFVEAWEQRGGKAGDDCIVAWLDENRGPFLRALSTFNR